jgi:hypothetical protein
MTGEYFMADSDSTSAQENVLPYAEITDDAYSEAAAQSFAVIESSPGILILRGPCPRCATVIDIPVVSNIFRAWRPAGGRGRSRTSKTAELGYVEPMVCTCEHEHPDRPEGLSGCGAYWTLTISASAQ